MGLRNGCAVAVRATFGLLFVLLSGKSLAQTADTIVNWAAAAQGGSVSVSSTASKAAAASTLIDGDRIGAAGTWQGKGNGKSGDWVQITFAAAQTIGTVTLISPKDNLANAAEPAESDTFTQSGTTDFDVQIKNGSNWTTVASIKTNHLIKRTVSFVPTNTTAIRITSTAGVFSAVEIEAWGANGLGNVAAASAQAVAKTSSSYGAMFPASALNDGKTSGATWGQAQDGGWANGSGDPLPNKVEILFPSFQVIHAVTLWTLQDNHATASPPDDSTTFTQDGLTAFDVQVLSDDWVTVASVTANDLVKRTVTFSPIAASRIRVVNKAGLNGYARIVELQAWGIPSMGIVHLTGMDPRSGTAGDTVTLYGENFSAVAQANAVTFNGVAAKVTHAEVGLLQIVVPSGAATGPVSVVTKGWTTGTDVPFTVFTGASPMAATSGPTITSFSPASGPAGTTVTITGTGFSATTTQNTVRFGSSTGATASVQTATTTSLTVVAPAGGTSGLIWVTVGGMQASSAGSYQYPPVISNISPTSGAVGDSITISGSGFSGVSYATFGGGVVQNGISLFDQNTMAANVPTGALSGSITVTTRSGLISNASTPLTVIIPPPTITGVSPTSGLVGATVTITGTNFSATAANNTVSFNGTAGTVTAASTTSLTTTVPAGATSGAISVTVNGMTANGPTFTVQLPAPTISSIGPNIGPRGTSVVINGANFSSTASNNQVYFTSADGTLDAPATVTAATPTSLTVTVPSNAVSGFFSVAVTGAVSSTTSNFPFSVTVPTPTITGFSPSLGPIGTSVTITGTNFGANTANNVVKFNGTSAAVTAASTTSLTATVPSGATSGAITVIVSSSQSGIASLAATSSGSYTVGYPPVTITGFTPTSGAVGTQVTISGTNFGASQGVGNVQLNGVMVSPMSWSDGTITFTVPAGAASGPITVVNNNRQSATTSSSFTIPAQAAAFVSQTVPSSMLVGTTASVSVTMQNIGTATWTTVQSYTLGSQGPANNGTWGLSRVALPADVPPGQSATFNFTITAPATAGTSNFQWQMLQEGGAWFGSTSPATSIVVSAGTPTISTISPSSGPRGTTMVINGTNFSTTASNNQVYFTSADGTLDAPAAVTAATPTSLTVTVPNNAVSGFFSVGVIGAASSATSNIPFTVTVPPPTITAFSPSLDPVGTSVTITGTNFSAIAANNSVAFNGTAATVTAASTTSLTATVPNGATSGPISVTVSSGQNGINSLTVTSSSNYTVGYPPVTITGVSPTSGPYGTVVTVTGTNFGASQGTGNLLLNGVIMAPTSWSDTLITFTVPDGSTDGLITVVNTARISASTTTPFIITNPAPSITGFTPVSGQVGDTVTLSGVNFSSYLPADIVKFNGTVATVTGASATSLTVTVPPGATTGKLSVTVNGKTGTSASDFTVIPTVTIASIMPTNGPPNTVVTIDGSNFDPVAANNMVFISGVLQPILYASANKLRIQIARGTTTGPITVYRVGPITVSAQGPTFTLAFPPQIQWIAPISSPANTQIALHGGSFDNASLSANSVTVNGVAASVSQATAGELDIWVPSQATSGPIVVTNKYGTSSAAPVRNVASAWSGATAASSTASAAYPASSAIDGDIAGGNWGAGGGWRDATQNAFPDWLQVNFATEQKINDVVVYTLQDNFAAGTDPMDSTTFTQYGLTAFDVQALQGSTWITVASVTGNNLVKRRVVFMPIVATAIRIVANSSADGQYSRIVEVEAHYDPSNFIVGPVPTAQITDFTPKQGGPGTQVTITGQFFGSDPASLGRVYFFTGQAGGQPAQVVSWSDTAIVVNVPVGAYNGPISVATPTRNLVTSTATFTYVPPPVTINSFTPIDGRVVFTNVTISGSGFSAVPDENKVTFSGSAVAKVLQADYTSLLVQVPYAAQTGPITVAVTIDGATQSVTSSSPFTVDPTPTLDAQLISQWPFGSDTVIDPMTYEPGATAQVQIVMQNIGLTPWSQGQSIRLAELDSSGWVASKRVDLPVSTTIAVGDMATFKFPVQMPATPGVYAFNWQMIQDSPTPAVRFGSFVSASVYVGPPPPQKPTCVLQTAPSTIPSMGTTTIQWQPPNSGTTPDSYRIAASEDGSTWSAIQGVAASTTSVTFTTTARLQYYAVAACEKIPGNACSSYVSAQTQVAGCQSRQHNPPNPPDSVTVMAPASGSTIGLSWVPSSTGSTATYFVLEVANSASGPWTMVNSHLPASPTSTTYTAPGNGTYYLGIQACNDQNDCSAFTISAPVTIGAANPSSCTGLSVSPTSINFAASGSAAQQVTVQAPSGCSWNIISTADAWLTVSPTSGLGSSTSGVLVNLTPKGANTTTSTRTGTLSVGGDGVTMTVAVAQAGTGMPVISPNLPPIATPINDAVTHDPTVGTMAGQASTDGGAAQYHVPIVVPPGRAGMQPDLALVYNSRSGNGVMGMGWAISGLSSIHRCPQTPEQDGRTLGVSYTNNDRLCLDGQRLVLVSGSSYGAANAVYRTEVDSYARITQVGGDLKGTSTCFRVEQKNGRVLHYGAVTGTMSSGVLSTPSCATSTAHSTVTPAGASAPLSWLVEKIEDRVGNNQLYAYIDNGNGEVLLNKVSYTGYNTTVGDRTVSFAYQARTAAAANAADISSSYLAGGLTMQTEALQSITTAVSGSTVRTYTPTYIASTYNGRLMMASITECAGGTCHQPTQFTYSDSALNFSFNAMTNIGNALPTGLQAWSFSSIGDLDGDGTPEYMVLGWNNSTNQNSSFLAKVAANGQITAVDMTGTPFYRDLMLHQMARGDIDGSGRTDFSILPAYAIDSNGNATPTSGNLQLGVWVGATGAPLSAGSTPQATFNSTFQTITTNIPVNSSSQVFFLDMNGDGKLDIVVTAPASGCSGRGVFVYLNNLTTTLAATSPVAFVTPSGPLLCMTSVTNSSATYDITNQAIDHIADFDGDGIPDIFVTDSNLYSGASNFVGVYLVKPSGSGTSATLSTNFTACGTAMGLTGSIDCKLAIPSSNGAISGVARWMDVNGDGLEDLVMAKPSAMSGSDQWIVYLNQGGGAYAAPITAQNPAGGPIGLSDKTYNGSYRYLNKLSPVDVDGDGKPEIVYPSQASGFALKMCTMVIVGPLASGCPDDNSTVAAPKTALAGAVQCTALACPEEPGTQGDPSVTGQTLMNMPANNNAPGYPFAWDGHAAAGLYTSKTFAGGPADHSAYHLDRLKFVQIDANTITVQTVPTSLVSGVNNTRDSSVSNDMGGTGLETIPTLLGCSGQPLVTTNSGTNTYYAVCDVVGDGIYGPQYLPDGPNGANGTLTSSFQPTPKAATTASAIKSTVSLYANFNHGASLPGQAPRNFLPSDLSGNCSSYFPLPGLMYSATNGLGDTTFWDYDTLAEAFLCTRDGVAEYQVDGTYNDSRHYYFSSSMPVVGTMLQSNGIGGYLGSRSAIYSYGDAMYNHYGRGFQGFRTITTENASSNATRRLVTTTTFNQKYPLVGKVASISTSPAPSSGIGTHPVHSEVVAYTCVQSNASTSACPVGDGLPTPTGGTVYQPMVSSQAANEYDLQSGQAASHSNTVNSVFDIYGNVLTQTVTRGDDAAGGLFLSNHTTTTTNSYSPNTANWTIDLPGEIKVQASIAYSRALPAGASAPMQTLDTQYTWNADRTPNTKVVQPQSVIGDANQQSTTTYSYPSPSYGLPSQVQITGSSLSLARTTSYGYSSDGYFVASTTNGLNQTVSTAVQASDGQVISATDPNNLTTSTTYDVFGRPTQITHRTSSGTDIESPINIAITKCNGGCAGPGSDANELYAAYRTVSTQQGYPTKVTWLDVLGRPVKAAQAGFSGTTSTALQYAFSATLTAYDENSTVATQSAPYYTGSGSLYYTEFAYDALNRIVAKSSPSSCGGTMDTTYAYAGRQTNITASGNCTDGSPANAAINMSRSTNALGQLMQTVDANGQRTSYWTEPLGHVVAMTDVEGNLTTASYNSLGQRTQSTDPDQGAWSFSYDALGELISQTDARGAQTKVTARDALGRVLTRTEIPPSPVPSGEAAGSWLDTWSYDPSNGIGEIYQITRQRGNASPLSTNPTVWQETYTYNPQAQLSGISTTVAEDTTVLLNSGIAYDNVGRVATQTYPSGLVVRHTYTSYGQLDALSNDTTGYVYWVAQAENAWGHLTKEQYPGVITGTHADFAATGQAQTKDYAGSVADHVAYTYDSFGNLAQQSRSGQAGYTETYTYDNLQRLTQASRNGTSVSYQYSPSGNLTKKSDFAGTYSYAGANLRSSSGCGPHAVNTATTATQTFTYNCDANGNVIGGSTIGVIYDQENHARTATRAGAASTWWAHSTNGEIAWSQSSRGSRYYGPNGYEQVGSGSGAMQVHELGPVVVTRTGSSDQVSVILRDRLGSTIDEIDGNLPTPRSYDAFGRPLESMGTARDTLGLPKTIHGFTKHEHDDDVLLINMVGRIYDYKLGRFLQVDPIIGGTGSQALNPYSYIGNNPLSGKDPTGYCAVGEADSHGHCGSGENVVSSVTNLSTGQTIAASSGASVQGTAVQGSANTSGASINAASSNATQMNEATPASNTPVLDTVTVSAHSNGDPTVPGGWIPADIATQQQTNAEWMAWRDEYEARGARGAQEVVLSMLLGPVKSEFDFVRGIYNHDDRMVHEAGMAILVGGVAPEATELVTIGRELQGVRQATIGGRAPINSGYAGGVHPSGIEFNTQGFPIFGPVSKAEVQLSGLTGNYAKDAAMANQAVGLAKTPPGYVWHHVEDGVTMQLVPQNVHNAVRHTGGAAVIRNGGFDQ